jgi:hypothetical protein
MAECSGTTVGFGGRGERPIFLAYKSISCSSLLHCRRRKAGTVASSLEEKTASWQINRPLKKEFGLFVYNNNIFIPFLTHFIEMRPVFFSQFCVKIYKSSNRAMSL